MEMTTIKSEENIGKFHVSMVTEAPQAARVKRRRRDSGAVSQQQALNQEAGAIATPTTVKRSSKYRGVSRHRWTGRYEAHLWDKLSWNITQKKKGKQGFLQSLINCFFICNNVGL